MSGRPDYQPTGVEPDELRSGFFEDHAEIIRRDRSLTTTLEVVVSSEDDAEMRRVSITNLGIRARDIQVTSYAELSLAPQAADAAHPAFSNLFVETEFVPSRRAARHAPQTLRRRNLGLGRACASSPTAKPLAICNMNRSRAFRGTGPQSAQSRFDHGRPAALQHGWFRCSIRSSACAARFAFRRAAPSHLIFSTIVASTREEVLDLADKYRDARTFERTHTLAWTQAQVQLHHLGITAEEAHLFQRLANAVLYVRSYAASDRRRAEPQYAGHFHVVVPGNFRRPADRPGAH